MYLCLVIIFISMISHAEANTCNQEIENIVRQLSPEKKLHEGSRRIQYDRFLDKIAISLNEKKNPCVRRSNNSDKTKY